MNPGSRILASLRPTALTAVAACAVALALPPFACAQPTTPTGETPGTPGQANSTNDNTRTAETPGTPSTPDKSVRTKDNSRTSEVPGTLGKSVRPNGQPDAPGQNDGTPDAANVPPPAPSPVERPWPAASPSGPTPNIVRVEQGKDTTTYDTNGHFRFVCDASLHLPTPLLRRLARTFEAVYRANLALPLNYVRDTSAGQHFTVRLCDDFESYHKHGGLTDSTGTYLEPDDPTTSGEVLFALPTLGIAEGEDGSLQILREDKATMAHEVTHQLMSMHAKQAAWFAEGSAEYMAMTPYDPDAATFDFTKTGEEMAARVTGFSKRTKTGRNLGSTIYGPRLKQMMTMSLKALTAHSGNRNYAISALMVYYFYRLDGAHDAARMKKYIQALQEGKSESSARKFLLDGRSYEQLESQITAAWRPLGVHLIFSERAPKSHDATTPAAR